MNKQLIKKFARLAIKSGVNLQKDQMLVINTPVNCIELTREIALCAYEEGASYVMVKYNDDMINKYFFTYAPMESVKEIPDYAVQQMKYIVENKAAVISISAPTPGLFKDVDPEKLMVSSKVTNEKLSFYRKFMMSNGSQWLVIAAPTASWASKVFPDVNEKEAIEKLWTAIFEACHVRIENNPVEEWQEHMEKLAFHNKKLNEFNFDSLHFKNGLGTDLDVKLVENHIWAGGDEISQTGIKFSPNIPTEEAFSMPHSHNVNGKVVATRPLNYQGKLIENFSLEFKDGKVVNYKAEKEQEALKSLLELDEGSSRLGEVALISDNSPISNMGILFYNTLFDENASCHLALGNAYTMNIKDGNSISEEELMKKGYNKSMVHVDFMFGSPDMEIVGTKKDGTKVQIFKNGNFAF